MDDQTQTEPDAPTEAPASPPPIKHRRKQPPAVVPVVVPLTDVTGKTPANWYDRVPLSAQMFMQFGFAGLMAVVFVVQFRENSAQNREAQTMYRDDNAALRAVMEKTIIAADMRSDKVAEQMGQMVHRIDKVSEKMTEVNHQLQRTTDALRSAGVDLKKAADKMDNDGGGSGRAPPPRVKFPPDGPPFTVPVTGPGGSL